MRASLTLSLQEACPTVVETDDGLRVEDSFLSVPLRPKASSLSSPAIANIDYFLGYRLPSPHWLSSFVSQIPSGHRSRNWVLESDLWWSSSLLVNYFLSWFEMGDSLDLPLDFLILPRLEDKSVRVISIINSQDTISPSSIELPVSFVDMHALSLYLFIFFQTIFELRHLLSSLGWESDTPVSLLAGHLLKFVEESFLLSEKWLSLVSLLVQECLPKFTS